MAVKLMLAPVLPEEMAEPPLLVVLQMVAKVAPAERQTVLRLPAAATKPASPPMAM